MAGDSPSPLSPNEHKLDVSPPPSPSLKRKVGPHHSETQEVDSPDSSFSSDSETSVEEVDVTLGTVDEPQFIYASDYDPDDDDCGEVRYAPDFQDEAFRTKYINYVKKIVATEGFDIELDDIPKGYCSVCPLPLDDGGGFRPILERVSRKALKKYNKDEGKNLEFVGLQKATSRADRGYMFFITFLARDPGGEPTVYQAKVRSLGDIETKVIFCRPKAASKG